jgi:hypothetical protein
LSNAFPTCFFRRHLAFDPNLAAQMGQERCIRNIYDAKLRYPFDRGAHGLADRFRRNGDRNIAHSVRSRNAVRIDGTDDTPGVADRQSERAERARRAWCFNAHGKGRTD